MANVPNYMMKKGSIDDLPNFKSYYNKILNGEIIVSKSVRAQCDKILTYFDKYYVEPELAQRPILFIESKCHNHKGDKKLLKLFEVQKMWIEVAYAFYFFDEQNTYRRRIRELLIQVSRGSGKSTLCSALGLYQLMADFEEGQEIYVLASTNEQANILFDSSHTMVKNGEWLQERIHKAQGSKLRYDKTNSVYQIKTADYDSLDGLNGSSFFDEIHSYKDDGRVIKIVTDGGFRKRKNPMSVYITTNGVVRGKAYDKLYNRAKKAIDGNSDEFLAFIYELDDIKEIHDENLWQKAIPLLDTPMLQREIIRQDIKDSNDDPMVQTELLSKIFGIPMNSSNSFLTNEQCKGKKFTEKNSIINPNRQHQQPVIMGLDLSAIGDFCSISFIIPDVDDEFAIHIRRYIPKVGIERLNKNMQVQYEHWTKKGLIQVHDEMINNQETIFDDIKKFIEENNLKPIVLGYDTWSATTFVSKFSEWFSGCICHKVGQSVKGLSPSMKYYHELAKSDKLTFSDEVLTWSLSNVICKKDANGNYFPNKETSNNKIDDFLSILDGLAAYSEHKLNIEFEFMPEDKQVEAYERLMNM